MYRAYLGAAFGVAAVNVLLEPVGLIGHDV
jgi:hypothetical protein